MTIEITEIDAQLLRQLLAAQLQKIEDELVHTDQRGMQREIAGDAERVRTLIHRLGFGQAS
ncbi:MAG TPA: hypothetical protein VFQ65_29625 [Kofleriaceae bacterium]|nr:hypothetical protein [Kofleriaceae bacterium]